MILYDANIMMKKKKYNMNKKGQKIKKFMEKMKLKNFQYLCKMKD